MVWCDEDAASSLPAHLPFHTPTPFPVRNVPSSVFGLLVLLLLGI